MNDVFMPTTYDQAWQFAEHMAASDLVPKDYKGKPANCFIAMQWGAELGMKPLQALQNIAPINGRPAVWGDAMIAIVRASPLCEYIIEDDNGHTATCRVKRRSETEQVRTFSVDDAQKAGLLGKQGPWTQYPKRMRQMRARGFALRDVFPDVLRGMQMAEEAMDTPPRGEIRMGDADVVPPPPAAPIPIEYMPASAFSARLAKVSEAIIAGRKTSEETIAWFSALNKGALTEEQKAQIRAIKPAPAPALFDLLDFSDRIAAAKTQEELDAMEEELRNGLATEEERRLISQALTHRGEELTK